MLTSAEPDPAPLEAWLHKQAAIRSLESDFVQERTLPSLKRPVTTKGKLWFRRPGLVRWELGQPPVTIAVADGEALTIADTIDKRVRRLPADDPQARAFTLLAAEAFHDREAFHRAFDLHDSRVVNTVYQATLRPVDRRLRARIPWIFIDISLRTSLLQSMELYLKDKTRIRNIFRAPRLNPEIPDERFKIDLAGYRGR